MTEPGKLPTVEEIDSLAWVLLARIHDPAAIDEVQRLVASLRLAVQRVAIWQAHDDAIRAALTAVTPSDKARDVVGSIQQLAAERDTFRRERDEAREKVAAIDWRDQMNADEDWTELLDMYRRAALAPKEPPRGDQT